MEEVFPTKFVWRDDVSRDFAGQWLREFEGDAGAAAANRREGAGRRSENSGRSEIGDEWLDVRAFGSGAL